MNFLNNWQTANSDPSRPIRAFKLKFENEKIILISSVPSGKLLKEDFNALNNLVTDDEACYLLFRFGGPKTWLLITYIPETVPGPTKMLMASSLSMLKIKLGADSINEDARMSTKDEVTYESFQQSKKPVESKSELELARERLIKLEEEERDSRVISAPSISSGSPVVEHNITPSNPHNITPSNTSAASPKSSGYHSVKMPLTDNATSALNNFATSAINFVHLKINNTHDKLDCNAEKEIQPSQLNAQIAVDQPGFYVYKHQRMGMTSSVFIYCCPGNSTPQLRMVYSTTKPTVSADIEKCGVRLAKKIEVTDASDVNPEYIEEEINPRVIAVNSFGNKPKPAPIVAKPHPVYSLINVKGDPVSAGRKKVVMPPPGAW